MKGTVVINQESQVVLAAKLAIAQTFWLRLKGLIGTTTLASGEGLLIRPCGSVHTIGMKYPIDVLFLSSDLRVLKVVHAMGTMRTACCLNSAMALELPAGTAAKTGTVAGQQLIIK